MRRDQRGQRVDADQAGIGGHAPVGRDGQHVAQPMIANGCPQPRVGAVDFVAGHPRGRYVCLDRAVDQRRGQAPAWWQSPCPAAGFPPRLQRSGSSVHDLGR